ncbi:unnamed protein product [Rhizophagus irregularis]|nr:unnamed protein product [Rhizophagus irregularis]CAB4411407.1 unnamed protein product [Rhizophagus irregularis]
MNNLDSLGVYDTWIQLFLDGELVWSTRRIWNANSLVLWKMVYKFVEAWDFMVYWRGSMMIGASPREFIKEINQYRYKVEWLALDINRSLRMNIIDVDIIGNPLDIIMKDLIRTYHGSTMNL